MREQVEGSRGQLEHLEFQTELLTKDTHGNKRGERR